MPLRCPLKETLHVPEVDTEAFRRPRGSPYEDRKLPDVIGAWWPRGRPPRGPTDRARGGRRQDRETRVSCQPALWSARVGPRTVPAQESLARPEEEDGRAGRRVDTPGPPRR